MTQLRLALPKGRLLDETAALLQKVDWGLSEYHKGGQLYRFQSERFADLSAKVFREKDIPIQVAIGNYDLGICGLDWVEELLVKYPSSALVKLEDLGYGKGVLYAVASRSAEISTVEELQTREGVVRIASEYPNLAEFFALSLRLRRFSIFPVWGGAEVYPPENADVALIPGRAERRVFAYDLIPIGIILSFNACLIANKNSWETKDMSQLLSSIAAELSASKERPSSLQIENVLPREKPYIPSETHFAQSSEATVRLALPDGHQQKPILQLLDRAGIMIEDYPSPRGNRRPRSNLEGVMIKVIRPQDMPLQVANGNFDLAITGQDWLIDHLYQFPSSPVTELTNLKSGRVKIVAVISRDLPVSDVYSLRQLYAERAAPLRVASEYVNIADKYARDNHLGAYKIVPTWGASEAFLPEDADLLIENTQTGQTIARHNLKIIDTLFESTACLIGNKGSISTPAKKKWIELIVDTLRRAAEEG